MARPSANIAFLSANANVSCRIINRILPDNLTDPQQIRLIPVDYPVSGKIDFCHPRFCSISTELCEKHNTYRFQKRLSKLGVTSGDYTKDKFFILLHKFYLINVCRYLSNFNPGSPIGLTSTWSLTTTTYPRKCCRRTTRIA